VELRRRLPLVAFALVLAGCGGGKSSNGTSTDANGCTKASPPPAKARTEQKPTKPLDPAKTYDVRFQTNCGSFTIRLAVKASPATTASFASLVQKGFFDGTVFHRIVPGFVIQGGDPTASGTGGPGYTTVDKPPSSASYDHGVVAMAKTGAQPPGAAGSQFFIVTGDNAGLPPDYAIIGKVTDGLDVVDHIGKLGDASEQPTQVVEIEQATVKTS
jgi:cyclophilin family peptidyl-prolyl cis-trans isomerase